jgi:hypothetical protein
MDNSQEIHWQEMFRRLYLTFTEIDTADACPTNFYKEKICKIMNNKCQKCWELWVVTNDVYIGNGD